MPQFLYFEILVKQFPLSFLFSIINFKRNVTFLAPFPMNATWQIDQLGRNATKTDLCKINISGTYTCEVPSILDRFKSN
jgi:hypothetical protein